MKTVIAIATANNHKAREISQILAGDFQFLTLNDFPGAPRVPEDAPSFSGNAVKKASALAAWISANPTRALDHITPSAPLPRFCVLADDSGLEVDALGGAPGALSARFAAAAAGGSVNTSDAANNAKLLRLLAGVRPEKRTARFRCVLAFIGLLLERAADGSLSALAQEPLLLHGVCEGRIGLAEAGGGGFGYDPLFIPSGQSQSFGQLSESEKNSLSHRSDALRKLLPLIAGY